MFSSLILMFAISLARSPSFSCGNRTEFVVLSITFEGNGYRVTSNGTGGAFETTRPVEVPQEAGPPRTVGGPLLLLVGLAGLGALGWVRRQHPDGLTDAERERLTFEDDREDFDEWISVIELPDEVLDRPRASADSLGSLVDFAIDTDNGVVEDPSRGLYCVLHDGYLYTYEPPQLESRPEGVAAASAQTAPGEMDGSATEDEENSPV